MCPLSLSPTLLKGGRSPAPLKGRRGWQRQNNMGFVYILKSETGRYYIGSTSDLKRRQAQHLQGQTWTTQRFKNPVLVFSQKYPSLEIARKVETKLKRLKRKDYIEKIIKDGFIKVK